jgi:hypothetical protein
MGITSIFVLRILLDYPKSWNGVNILFLGEEASILKSRIDDFVKSPSAAAISSLRNVGAARRAARILATRQIATAISFPTKGGIHCLPAFR